MIFPASHPRSWYGALRSFLARDLRIHTLYLYRVIFSSFLLFELFERYGTLETWYGEPRIFLRYPGLEWVPVPGLVEAQFLLLTMVPCAACLLVGIATRAVAAWLAAGYALLLFADIAYYNNHHYLVLLLLCMFALVPAGAGLSLVSPGIARPIRGVDIFVFRAQWVLVYFFGGVAKMNPDWLRGEPVRKWLVDSGSALVDAVGVDALAMFVAWGGMLFDLLVGFLLFVPGVRWLAVAAAVVFHVSNHFLFEIGIFPWLSLASLVLFFDVRLPQLEWGKAKPLGRQSLVTFTVLAWLAVSCLIPLRHFAYPGHVEWTRRGLLFSWRMKLSAIDSFLAVLVSEDGRQWREVEQSQFLNSLQILRLRIYPYSVRNFVIAVREHYAAQGREGARFQVRMFGSLNGRPLQYWIDAEVDLADTRLAHFWESEPWIVPVEWDAEIGDYPATEDEMMQRIVDVVERPPR